LAFFVLTVGMARSLGAAVSGQVFFVVNFYALVLLVVGLSGESGLGFYTAKKELPPMGAALAALGWTGLATGLLWCLLCFFPQSVASLPMPGFNAWLLLYLGGYLLLVFFTALFNAGQNFVLPNLVALVANMVLIALLPWRDGPGAAEGFMRWYFLAYGAQGLVLALLYITLYGKSVAWPKPIILHKVVRYSLQALAANLIFFLVYRIDYWLVNYFCADKALLGNYIQVSKLAQVFFIVPGIVATTVFSVTAASEKGAMGPVVQRLARLIFTGALLACAVLALVGHWLFPWVFGSGFEQMYLPFLLLVPGILAIAMLYPYTAYYAGQNKVRVNIMGNLLALAVIVVADGVLIPLWDIKGAALASSLGYTAYQWWTLARFKKEHAIRLRDCFLLQKQDWHLLTKALSKK
jgi:O-antigen/teichoic acid export membrane protein